MRKLGTHQLSAARLRAALTAPVCAWHLRRELFRLVGTQAAVTVLGVQQFLAGAALRTTIS
jgi:hypothetical protein